MIEVKIIDTSDSLYQQELTLRDQVLRIPLGMSIYNDDLSDEPNQVHFLAIHTNEVIGVVILKKEGNVGKLRQMAVKPEFQGQQIGRKLVEALEEYAAKNGIKEVKMHARYHAEYFYEKLGYHKTSKPHFEEVGMKHYEMAKQL
ncbi:Acetyltransferase (GNAT) domain-containing protein [Spirosomataceae bacterium TFI 002]|nr:Acetyltransferase (GNAT) domain-containing protein [Spirosomataceae bacterium TFI 002]